MDSKDKKYTFLVLSHNLKKDFKFTLTARAFWSWVGVGGFLVLALCALLIDYWGLFRFIHESRRLQAENAALIQQFRDVEGKLETLEKSIERVRNFALKLELITNIDDQNRGLQLSAGIPNSAGQVNFANPVVKEDWLNEIQTEGEFAGEIPLNESRGEIAKEVERGYSSLTLRIDRALRDTELQEQSVVALWESLADRQTLVNSTPSIRPARGWISSGFGYRTSPITGKLAMHAGLDIVANVGSPVYATADGVVSFVGWDEGYGKLVSIDHGFGVVTRYGHNSQIYVKLGQRVNRWDVISAIGNTGRSTGPHLHYEVRVHGIPRNPMLYILQD